MKLLTSTQRLFVAKGKKFVELDLKQDHPSMDELLKLVLGPTGNLRAPTLRVGKTLLVGFNQEMYDQVFSG